MRKDIIDELNRLAERGGGRIQRRDLVVNARNEDSPLHSYFDWDNTTAAKKWRIHQAGRLLRFYWRELPLDRIVVRVPLYMSSAPVGGQKGYVNSIELDAPAVVALAVRDIEAFDRRYRALLLMHGYQLPVDLIELVGLRKLKETAA